MRDHELAYMKRLEAQNIAMAVALTAIQGCVDVAGRFNEPVDAARIRSLAEGAIPVYGKRTPTNPATLIAMGELS